MKITEVMNAGSCYQVGKRVADNAAYRTYLCKEKGTERQCLFLISTDLKHNAQLDRWAYVLRELKRKSDEIEEEYARSTGASRPLNYDLEFPEVLTCFVAADQGNRRILILTFRSIETVTEMVPLSNLTSKDRLRVDLRTSVWIIGKLLKLLTFAHSEGFATELMSGRNILIAPNRHYTLVFDWSRALMAEPGQLPTACMRKDIMGAARAALVALGSDLAKGTVPDTDDAERPYIDHLFWLAKGNTDDAQEAHRRLYEISDSLWERQFHPFTTKPL